MSMSGSIYVASIESIFHYHFPIHYKKSYSFTKTATLNYLANFLKYVHQFLCQQPQYKKTWIKKANSFQEVANVLLNFLTISAWCCL